MRLWTRDYKDTDAGARAADFRRGEERSPIPTGPKREGSGPRYVNTLVLTFLRCRNVGDPPRLSSPHVEEVDRVAGPRGDRAREVPVKEASALRNEGLAIEPALHDAVLGVDYAQDRPES